MKRNLKTKLRLDRETLVPLQHEQLDDVNGGVKYTGCLSQCTQCGGGGGGLSLPRPPQRPSLGGGGESLGGGGLSLGGGISR